MPLVDVMLVLLVVFIISAPLLTHSLKVDLPKAASSPNLTQPEHIEFAVREDGSLYWNGAPIAPEELPARFAAGVLHGVAPEAVLVEGRIGGRPVEIAADAFSRLGVPAVTVLFIAGGVLAWLQLASLTDLTGSPYGRLIIGKLALFGGLIVLASLNRFRYLPRLARATRPPGRSSAARSPRRSR